MKHEVEDANTEEIRMDKHRAYSILYSANILKSILSWVLKSKGWAGQNWTTLYRGETHSETLYI